MRLLISVPIGRATFEEMEEEADWRAAIQDGVLRRDTLVTLYRGDDPGVAVSAGDVDELGVLFDELLGAAPEKGKKRDKDGKDRTGGDKADADDTAGPAGAVGAPAAEEPSEALDDNETASPSMQQASAESEQASAESEGAATSKSRSVEPSDSGKPALARPDPQPASVSSPPAGRTPPGTRPVGARPGAGGQPDVFARLIRNPITWTVLIVVLLIMVISTCTSGGSSGNDGAYAPGETATMYVGRVINVRDFPSRSSSTVGALERGEELHGVWRESEGETWFEITSGSNAGRFVWGGNLVPQVPPPITGEPSVERVLLAADMFAEPRYGGRILAQLSEGQSVDVLGWTADGWAEVAIERLGIGYVAGSAFQPPVESDSAETAPPPSSEPTDCRLETFVQDGAMYQQEYCRTDGSRAAVGRPILVRREPETPVQTGRRPPRPDTSVQTQPPSPRQPDPRVPPPVPPRTTPPVTPSPGTAPPAIISRPEWTRRPDFNDFNRVMPQAALDAGQQGTVGLSCRVSSQGRLDSCAVVSETPEGWGFGRAALRITPSFRMAARDQDGFPTAGRTVRFSITFAFEDE